MTARRVKMEQRAKRLDPTRQTVLTASVQADTKVFTAIRKVRIPRFLYSFFRLKISKVLRAE